MFTKFVSALLSSLKKEGVVYAICGNYENLPYSTENDIDIWVSDHKKAFLLLYKVAKNLDLKPYLINQTANGSNNYFYYGGENTEIIKVDLMHETAWNSIFPIITDKIIKSHIKKYRDFNVIDDDLTSVMHLIYPLLTFNKITDKYKEKLQIAAFSEQFLTILEKITSKKIANFLITKLQNKEYDLIEGNVKMLKRVIIFNTLKQFDIKRIIIIFRYLISISKRILTKNGIFIALTGIDGAGKTTIVNFFKENHSRYFGKKKYYSFYWRPFLLPRIANLLNSRGQEEVYDTSGKRIISNNLFNTIKNYIKYFYHVIDFIVGRIKYFRILHTGGIVIADRYHLDNIIYPERFGFSINKKLMRFVDKYLIPSPDILCFLDAKTDTLLKRKREIDKNEIEKQKELYYTEINKIKNVVVVNSNSSFDETINEILLLMLSKMSRRYSNEI